jgi:hypothetical protein
VILLRRAFSPKPEAAAGMEAFPKKLIVFLHTVRAAKVMTGGGVIFTVRCPLKRRAASAQ